MSEFAGLLKTRIEIWQRTGARTASGSSAEEWEPVTRCLARIDAEGAGPSSEAMALTALPRFRVTIRSQERLAIDQRVHWGSRKLSVRQIIADPGTPDRMTLRCEELRA